jgi:hypothetical protein
VAAELNADQLLAGRYFEARSKRRAGAALRALLELHRFADLVQPRGEHGSTAFS